MRTCEHCQGKMTRPKRISGKVWAGRKYCSQVCANDAKTIHDRPCGHCGGTLTTPNHRTKYCSLRCFGRSRALNPVTTRYRRVTTTDGRVMAEHRAVMTEALGRSLTPQEVVHHKNGDKLDNRLANLEVMTVSEHSRMHMMGNRNAAR